ncbi:MAG: PEP-CTERM sorting domain-containing protein [Gammaproteobacteria bacterium]
MRKVWKLAMASTLFVGAMCVTPQAAALAVIQDTIDGGSLTLRLSLSANWDNPAGGADVYGTGVHGLYPKHDDNLDMDDSLIRDSTAATNILVRLEPSLLELLLEIGYDRLTGKGLQLYLALVLNETVAETAIPKTVTYPIPESRSESISQVNQALGPTDIGAIVSETVVLPRVQAAQTIPEPATLPLLVFGAIGLAWFSRKFKKQADVDFS